MYQVGTAGIMPVEGKTMTPDTLVIFALRYSLGRYDAPSIMRSIMDDMWGALAWDTRTQILEEVLHYIQLVETDEDIDYLVEDTDLKNWTEWRERRLEGMVIG